MLETILTQKKKAIVGKWLDLIAESHPAGDNLFKDKDQFNNPVGYTISSEVEPLYDELLRGNTCSEEVALSLDRIIRITAVQEFTPSHAIGFIFLLKKAIKEELGRNANEKQMLEDLLELYNTIDKMGFTAFDMYASCREKLMELRVNQVKNDRDNAFRLMERMLLKHEELEDVAATGHNNVE